MLRDITENAIIDRLTNGLPRSPLQLNKVHGSDSEIIRIPGTDGRALAATIDTISEEIISGLYADPWLIGWMAVMVNMSDLAAVGAVPLGILISETFPPDLPQGTMGGIQQGIRDACDKCATYVLGGDTNFGRSLAVSGCALGLLEAGKVLSRTQCKPGDALYASGFLGSGNAYAVKRLIARIDSPTPYKPLARLRQGQMLVRYASCCMDTSDGALATLDELMRLNGCGFSLGNLWRKALSEPCKTVAEAMRIPDWLFLAGEHGEFELIFTVSRDQENELLEQAESIGWEPVILGEVIPSQQLRIVLKEQELVLDTGEIRNLGTSGGKNVEQYLQSLLAIDARLGEETTTI
jgi:thiamine-monophosphate kinase